MNCQIINNIMMSKPSKNNKWKTNHHHQRVKIASFFSVRALYDNDTGQMLDYKKLTNHHNKERHEWWQNSSANEFRKLLKGVE